MKGVIFTGFLDWVEEAHGQDFVDRLLDGTELGSGGAYTAVGNYEYRELVAMANVIGELTASTRERVLEDFARASFGPLADAHRFLIEEIHSGCLLIEALENHIHVEALKLYPGTYLPSIRTAWRPDGSMEVHYTSDEGLACMCLGRIWGALDLYGHPATVEVLSISDDKCTASFLVREEVS